MKCNEVFVYGDVNVDLLVPNVREIPTPGQEKEIDLMQLCVGGGAALFALGLGKLGVNVGFGGYIGMDLYGDYIQREMEHYGLDTSRLRRITKYNTGISISFTEEKDRSFLTYRGACERMNLDDITEEDIMETNHIHLTGYSGQKNHKQFKKLLNRVKNIPEVTVSMDVGWDDSNVWDEGIFELLPMLDVIFMNETECLHYTRGKSIQESLKELMEKVPCGAIKLGAKGAVGFREKEIIQVPSFPVKAVDTTGAGDSFNAGFIYGYVREKSLKECLVYGNACGAMSVTGFGGNTAFPTRVQLEKFLEGTEE